MFDEKLIKKSINDLFNRSFKLFYINDDFYIIKLYLFEKSFSTRIFA